MLQAAEIKATDKVLVVGCATGYVAAVIAKFAGEVIATESDSALAQKAADALGAARLWKCQIRAAAAAEGDAANAPYDVIVLNGATEIAAEAALRAAPGGRPPGRGFCHPAAVAGHDRDPCPRRFRPSGAVRRRRPGPAGAGTGPAFVF